MTDPRDSNGDASDGDGSGLSERLRRLDAALSKVRRTDDRQSAGPPASTSDAQGMARALRLSSEFVAGIIVGTGIGWFFDRMLGTSPLGLIVFFLLGFAAGVFNVMRAAGLSKPAPPNEGG